MSDRYESIHVGFWTQADMEGWTPCARLLYLWFITNPLGHGITGIGQVTPKTIAGQTGISPRQQASALQQIGRRVRKYAGDWYWVVRRFRWECVSPNHFKGAVQFLSGGKVPREIVSDFLDEYAETPQVLSFKGFPKDLASRSKPLEVPCKPLVTPIPVPVPSPIPVPEIQPPQSAPPPAGESVPTPPKEAKRRKPRAKNVIDPRAVVLIDHYLARVATAGDHSRDQAIINLSKLLAEGKHPEAVLRRCIDRHAEECRLLDRKSKYCVFAANFFGQKATYKPFLSDAYVPPRDASKPPMFPRQL